MSKSAGLFLSASCLLSPECTYSGRMTISTVMFRGTVSIVTELSSGIVWMVKFTSLGTFFTFPSLFIATDFHSWIWSFIESGWIFLFWIDCFLIVVTDMISNFLEFKYSFSIIFNCFFFYFLWTLSMFHWLKDSEPTFSSGFLPHHSS